MVLRICLRAGSCCARAAWPRPRGPPEGEPSRSLMMPRCFFCTWSNMLSPPCAVQAPRHASRWLCGGWLETALYSGWVSKAHADYPGLVLTCSRPDLCMYLYTVPGMDVCMISFPRSRLLLLLFSSSDTVRLGGCGWWWCPTQWRRLLPLASSLPRTRGASSACSWCHSSARCECGCIDGLSTSCVRERVGEATAAVTDEFCSPIRRQGSCPFVFFF